jgi:hypothetical protein
VTRVSIVAIGAAIVAALALAASLVWYRSTLRSERPGLESPDELRQQIVALDTERAWFRKRLDDLVGGSRSLEGMPETPVKVAVPTRLLREVVEHVLGQMTDSVTLQLSGLRVHRAGTIRRRIVLGDYDLEITITRVTATLRPGRPRLEFAGNRINASLPLTLAAGSGSAVINLDWDGRSIAGALCGDMTLVQTVSGTVTPRTYPISGALLLETSESGFVVRPRLPRLRVHFDVVPSDQSWADLKKVLDDKRGLCGFVLDRVDVLGAVKRVVDRGFNARIPTERLPAVALPVRMEPTLLVRGAPVKVGIGIGELSVTDRTIWLGANVDLDVGALADASTRR